jgi:hypothetical protein
VTGGRSAMSSWNAAFGWYVIPDYFVTTVLGFDELHGWRGGVGAGIASCIICFL